MSPLRKPLQSQVDLSLKGGDTDPKIERSKKTWLSLGLRLSEVM